MKPSPPDGPAGEEPLSQTVIRNVAGHKGTEALMLDPPLYEVLDPDSLDALFAGEDGPPGEAELTFEYCGCRVTVSSDGFVLVEDAAVESEEESTTA